eukprot:1307933-Rhodomonas_salina.1
MDLSGDSLRSLASTFEVACFDSAYLQEDHQIDANDLVWKEIQLSAGISSAFLHSCSNTPASNGKGDFFSFTPKQETKEQSLVDRIVGIESATKCVSLVFGLPGVAEFEHIVDGKLGGSRLVCSAPAAWACGRNQLWPGSVADFGSSLQWQAEQAGTYKLPQAAPARGRGGRRQ